jgi:hypothetical protein
MLIFDHKICPESLSVEFGYTLYIVSQINICFIKFVFVLFSYSLVTFSYFGFGHSFFSLPGKKSWKTFTNFAKCYREKFHKLAVLPLDEINTSFSNIHK